MPKHVKNHKKNPTPAPKESSVSVVITVGWMLGALATLGSEVLGAGVKIYEWAAESTPDWIRMMTSVLFLMALVAGIFTLIMTPICYRVRPTPPPKSLTKLVIAIAIMPLLVLLARSLVG